jgi:hypothetical protein
MSRGISLHIGLNNVDTSAYPDYTIPVLAGCINDANAMKNIASTAGFTTMDSLIDGQATAMNVKNKIIAAASQLTSGDIFFLTYSGHGGQLPDETGAEDDGSNETWILYDRQLIDDELYAIWPQFAQGVRIFVLSDSCHSGTMVKYILLNAIADKKRGRTRGVGTDLNQQDMEKIATLAGSKNKRDLQGFQRNRSFPILAGLKDYLRNKNLYQNIQQLTKLSKDVDAINAALIFISGCQDNQLSGDGNVNGKFTEELLKVWNNGVFDGTYKTFYDQIIGNMPSDQTPNYMTLGTDLTVFEEQKPFTLISPASGGASDGDNQGGNTNNGSTEDPSVSAPSSWKDSALAPTFNINRGNNPLYYVEVATDSKLFNYDLCGNLRSETNFYATWNDASINYMLFSSPQYQLPQSVWDNLKAADNLYYRIGTTMDTQWNGWKITTTDENSSDAPKIEIVKDSVDSEDTDQPTPDTPTDQPEPSPDTPQTDEDQDEHARIVNSVGSGGKNDSSDVKIIQRLLSKLTTTDGGSPSITIDGVNGPGTISAIKTFQRANELNESGLFRPDKGSVILLYIKSGIATMEYA